jgi:hypothetical protein
MGFLAANVESMNQSWPVAPEPIAAVTEVVEEKAEPIAASVVHGVVAQAVDMPCPQNQDCPAGGFASRIFECQEGCGFQGCAACMEIHEAEPHASDSMTLLEMARHSGVVG